MKQITFIFAFCILHFTLNAQYAPQAGITGSDAIPSNSTQIVGWATHCVIKKGWMDIAQQSLGYANSGDSTLAVGAENNMVVSLGDSGVATLTFALPIMNGSGADFAIFENGFLNANNNEEAFLELAFVEVSSDGVNFYRFPATSQTQTTQQISGTGAPGTGDYINARQINNLAGKYISNFGTPFDLEEMKNITGLDVNHVTHVRLVDVVGDVGVNARYDRDGNKINDPYPTPFPTCGFDLDAVAVIYQANSTAAASVFAKTIHIYPNPVADNLFIKSEELLSIKISDASGKILYKKDAVSKEIIDVNSFAPGVYFITMKDKDGKQCTKRFIKI